MALRWILHPLFKVGSRREFLPALFRRREPISPIKPTRPMMHCT
jgi:hypothetical protein